MTEESKVSGENSPQDQGAEWQNMGNPEEDMSAGMSDEDQERYEEWMNKREAGVEMEDFEGETNQTFKKEHGKYVYDEDGNHVMRERSDSAFDLTPRLKGESNAHYGARLKYNNMLAQKAEEFPWSEEDIRYDDYGNRDRVKEQEDWRAKAGIPSFDEYFESLGGENGDPDAAETAEEEASESYWHKIGKEGQRELVHKHPRKMGESNEEWAKRIEEEEGRKIFTADMGANIPNETGASAEAENGSVDGQAAEAQDRVAAGQEDVAADGGASAEEAASEEAVSESESQDVAEAIDSSVDPAAEVVGESDDAAVAETNEVTMESAEDSTDKKAEESAESAEAKERQRLLDIVGTAEFATWLKEKGLTNGDVESKTAEELQALIDERSGASVSEDKGEEKPKSEETSNVDAKSSEKAPESSREIDSGRYETLVKELNEHLDKAQNYGDVSAAWRKIDTLLESCSEEVKKTVAYEKLLRTTNNIKNDLEETRRSLRRLPAFTLPWGKMHDRKESLREILKSQSYSYNLSVEKLDDARYALPDAISDEDKARVDTIMGMYLRTDGIHEESNVRSRLKNIARNEKELSDGRGTEEYNARMRQEIAEHRKFISDYQESHPDFVLEPDDTFVNKHFEESAEAINDTFEDAEGTTVLERAKRRLARRTAIVESLESRAREQDVRLGDLDTKQIKQAREDILMARKIILSEGATDLLPEDLRAEWRSDVKEAETEMEVNSYDESYKVLESLKTDNEAQARQAIEQVFDDYVDEFIQPFLTKVFRYGGEKGKALAQEYRKKFEDELAARKTLEEGLSDKERIEVGWVKDWYAAKKQEQPDASKDDIHRSIISGLGRGLDIPGYRLGDRDNPDAKPTDEQRARLEELYRLVISPSVDLAESDEPDESELAAA